MKSKLTLSLPAETIQEAKMIAKQRDLSVSGLFSESLTLWKANASQLSPDMSAIEAGEGSGMEDLLGVFQSQRPFDARSAHIRQKHG
ncbi:MAG: hypothetical protein GVY36_10935 [Verrucomicrobia bacterium]|jgi:hypothetical protein|nr:hypothetical protein [Verrucomicrobiota bacterium]